MNIAQLVHDALVPLADPQRAAAQAAYMKDHFRFFGIPMAQRRAATAAIVRHPALKKAGAGAILGHAQVLWRQPERDFHYTALDLLARQKSQLSPDDVPDLLALVQANSWWDTVDGLAGIIGDILLKAKSHAHMDAALKHEVLWVRRVAMIHQLGWRGATDTERLFAYAKALAHEKDFFIRKAIGWALRDYAKHQPDAVRSFLSSETANFSGLTVREAAKHL